MEYKFINIQKIVSGKLIGFESRLNPKKTLTERIKLSELKNGETVITKNSTSGYKDLNYHLVQHEMNVINMLNSLDINQIDGLNVAIPKIYDSNINSKYIGFTENFVEGHTLSNFSQKEIKGVLEKVIVYLEEAKQRVSKSGYDSLFYQQPQLIIMLSAFWDYLKTLSKSPARTIVITKVYFHLLSSYFSSRAWRYGNNFSHGGLYEDSILYDEKTGLVNIIDWEVAGIRPDGYDLATLSRTFEQFIGKEAIIDLIINSTRKGINKNTFIFTSYFESLNILSSHDRKTDLWESTMNYITNVFPTIKNEIAIQPKSPFEKINSIALLVIYYINKLIPAFLSRSRDLILCYHSIGYDNWRFTNKPEDFLNHLNFLTDKYQVVGISDLFDKKVKTKKSRVVITFDDGYNNILENAYPLLKEHGHTATIFVLSNPKKANRSELDNQLTFMTRDEVKFLKSEGWEVGHHTKTHSFLGELSMGELIDETVDGKKQLEEWLESEVRYFAYPKGYFDKKVLEVTESAGFKAAFTVDGKTANVSANRLLIDRIPLDSGIDVKRLEAILSPLGVMSQTIFLRLLQIKERLTRK